MLKQTYENWELIIVDDCSTDNTEKLINKEFDDKRINYHKLDVNKGNAGARNKGVEKATGEYIAFLDSDDEYHSDYLIKALECLIKAKDDASFLWSGTRTISLNGESKDSIWVPSKESFSNQFLYELHVGIGRGFLLKKECFSHLKFDERLRTAVDTDFLIRLKQKYNYTILKEIVLTIHSQVGSVRSNYYEKKKSYNIIIEKHEEIINNDKTLKFKWYYKLLWLALYDNDNELASKSLKQLKGYGIKPKVLFMVFTMFPTKIAIKLHRLLS